MDITFMSCATKCYILQTDEVNHELYFGSLPMCTKMLDNRKQKHSHKLVEHFSSSSLSLHPFLDPVQIMNNLRIKINSDDVNSDSDSTLTSVNTPGVSALPQPRPQLTTPARTKWSEEKMLSKLSIFHSSQALNIIAVISKLTSRKRLSFSTLSAP